MPLQVRTGSRSAEHPLREFLGRQGQFERHARIMRVVPVQLATQRPQVWQSQENGPDPADRSERLEPGTAGRDFVHPACIMTRVYDNARSAPQIQPLELASLKSTI